MDLDALDAYVDERRRHFEIPGVAYGVISSEELVHARALGEARIGTGTTPTSSTVFRIASMSKSFTAAQVMLLRDRGLLRLDDPVATYLPWTSELQHPGGGPAILIRDLLSMNAGFPTDDPWGDRQEDLPIADFDDLVAAGLSMNRAPRTGFEYSNLGYALLGRVIEQATGVPYGDAVRRDLLEPLGLQRTYADHSQVIEPAALGYHPRADGLVPEPLVGPGAFTPMGGILSCVDDLAVWVRGFMSSWTDDGGHPLARWSRREMQEPQTLIGTETIDDASVTTSYGFGLMVEDHALLGRFVHHSGGYPGFGSHMRWHPASGLGIVALGNRTYAPMRPIAAEALRRLVADSGSARTAPELWPRTLDAMGAVETLINRWDDDLADRWFAMNMDMDVTRDERRRAVEAASIGMGTPTRADIEAKTPAYVTWRLIGDGGSVRITMLMSPTLPSEIQALTITREDAGGR